MKDQDRLEKFTEPARNVLSYAQEEAQRFQHNFIGTEHLLLGLVREQHDIAGNVLKSMGVELTRVRSAVEIIIGRGDRVVSGEVGLTPRGKKVIELAVDEARAMHMHYIGTEHILLGLVREGEGIAAGVLNSLGVQLWNVRIKTLQLLAESGVDVESVDPSDIVAKGTLSPLSVPAAFTALVASDKESISCEDCATRNPHYFSYCFQCGRRIV